MKELGTNGADANPSLFQRKFESKAKESPFGYTRPEEVQDLLTAVLHSKYTLGEDLAVDEGDDDGGGGGPSAGGAGVGSASGGGTVRTAGRMSAYSGGEGMVYEQIKGAGF